MGSLKHFIKDVKNASTPKKKEILLTRRQLKLELD